MEDQEYLPVPWHNEPFWVEALAASADLRGQSPRLSLKFPGQVAYFASANHAATGRLTACRPGKYLTRWCPTLPQPVVALWALRGACAGRNAVAGVEAENEHSWMRFATTREEIAAVYTSGGISYSCMSGDASEYKSKPVHPSEVYAAGDLAVAYAVYPGTEYVIARVLVWPDRKLCGRFYFAKDNELLAAGFLKMVINESGDTIGTEGMLKRYDIITPFYDALTALGYDISEQCLTGARLLKLTSQYGDLVCPYTDYPRYVEIGSDYLYLCGDPDDGIETNTDGIIPDRDSDCDDNSNYASCYHCGCDFDLDSEGASCIGPNEDRDVCDSCMDRHYSSCTSCGVTTVQSDMSTNAQGRYYCESCWADGCVTCETCEDTAHYSDMHSFGNAYYCDDCIVEVRHVHEAVPEGWVRVGTQDEQPTLCAILPFASGSLADETTAALLSNRVCENPDQIEELVIQHNMDRALWRSSCGFGFCSF